MKVHLDHEDDLFLIPTIVISKVNSKYLNVITFVHFAWLKWSIVFIFNEKNIGK